MNNKEYKFNDKESLIDSLSKDIINKLEKEIFEKGKATLLVSGGSTPKPLFEKLSTINIAWNTKQLDSKDQKIPSSSSSVVGISSRSKDGLLLPSSTSSRSKTTASSIAEV